MANLQILKKSEKNEESNMRRITLTSLVVIMALACSPKLQEADISIPHEYLYNRQFTTKGEPTSGMWWLSFQDTTLNALIAHALENNRDLEAAAANVISAQHYIATARAEYLPSLSFDASAEVLYEEETKTQEYYIEPTISWELSLFGKLKNTNRSAKAAFFAEEWNYRGVILSLTSEVATSYYDLLLYKESLDIARKSYELRREATALVDSLFSYGMSDGIALMQAKSMVYSAKIEIQKYQRATELTNLSLLTLLGENPQSTSLVQSNRKLTDGSLPSSIPIGLPSSLLERRPDIMESYFNMEKAAANVGISRAERYPSIALTGSGGIYASLLKGLTSGKPLAWGFTGSITEPVFNFGALKRREEMAREAYISAMNDYEQTILEAFSDVESALVEISTTKEEYATTAHLVSANENIANMTSALYQNGLGNYLSVIDAERELYSSQISLAELSAEQYQNYISLFKALGGGW